MNTPNEQLPVSDETRVAAQSAIWQALKGEGVTPTPGMVRVVRADVEEVFARALSGPITAPEVDGENARLRTAMERAAAIIERHNGIQNEKVDDARLILRAALRADQ